MSAWRDPETGLEVMSMGNGVWVRGKSALWNETPKTDAEKRAVTNYLTWRDIPTVDGGES